MSNWDAWLAYACPALLLTIVGLFLRRAALDPKTHSGDAALIDLVLGIVAIVAFVLWIQVLALVAF